MADHEQTLPQLLNCQHRCCLLLCLLAQVMLKLTALHCFQTTLAGQQAVAEGQQAVAEGQQAVAEGQQAVAAQVLQCLQETRTWALQPS